MNDSRLKDSWDVVISSRNSVFEINLKQIWRYRDLLWILVRRDFVAFYKQTVLGPLWFFIQPMFTIAIYVFIFGNLAGISTEGLPQPLFYLSGIIIWSYFSDSVMKVSTVFRDNAAMFGKVYFPRLIMPLSIVLSSLVRFLAQLLLMLVLIIYYISTGVKINIGISIILFPFLILLTAILSLGIGLIVTSLTTKYRDVGMLLSFAIQLLVYACPVVYPLSVLPDKWQKILSLNPLTNIIEGIRVTLLGQGEMNYFYLAYSFVICVIILVIGIIVFNKQEKSFVDTI